MAFALAFGSAAEAQSVFCASYSAEVAAAKNVAPLEQLLHEIPATCPAERSAAAARLKQLQAYVTARTPKPAPIVHHETGAARGRDEPADFNRPEAAPDAPAEAATPPAPLVPCSVAAVEAQFPQIPQLGSDPGPRSDPHGDLAPSYVRRAAAFHACRRDGQALGDLNDAMRLDPHSFTAANAAGDLALSAKDFDTAITDYTAAIALEDYVPEDRNGLTAYAGRAAAEASLKRYPDEIRDLMRVTQHYNDDRHETLAPLSIYHEALAKALYRSGQADAAASELTDNVEVGDRDAEDLQFLGQRRLQDRDWVGAIALFQQALVKMPDDNAARPGKARIEVLLAQAFEGSGDKPEALNHYRLASDYDPGNRDAAAGHASIGDPPPPPTFEDPTLRPISLPGGLSSVADLATYQPGPFCNQVVKNDFLDTVSVPINDVSANITTIAAVSDDLLKKRAGYDADPRLDYNTKISDEAMFDRQLQKLRDESRAFYAEGVALNAFFRRISADASDLKVCKPGDNAGGGR
ncbi:MAG TPA: hypothetical protein VHW60_04075 [Caulobacteraceae bacterium]|nr:hypothetical protein [Caulobacteraceae bacterium]